MTQTVTPRPPVKWIVPLPENDPYGKKSFTNACRGNSDLGEVLNYFLYAASKEVEQDKSLDTSTGSITVDRMLDTISKYLKVSKKTAIARIQKLAGWEFITPHGYHHRYDVHFKKIEVAIINPPEVEKPKLRGRHAVKTTILTIPTILEGKEHQDCKDLPDLPDGRIVVLETQIVNLQSQIVNLTAWIVNLQSQIVKLQSLQSSESTSQEAGEAQIDPLIITNNYSNITDKNIDVNADALTPTQTPSENNTHYQHSEGSSPQDIHTEPQASDDPLHGPLFQAAKMFEIDTPGWADKHDEYIVESIEASEQLHIANPTPQTDALVDVPIGNTDSLFNDMPPTPNKENSNGHTPRKVVLPVMPPDDVAWNAETLVQVLEARQGRRFPNGAKKKVDRVRDQALRDAEAIIDMEDIDRIAFVLAVDHLENRKNKWWLDNVGHVQPRHLLKNDKIHEMIDELKRQYGPSWREKLMSKTTSTATRKPSGPLAVLPPPPKSNAELRMEAV